MNRAVFGIVALLLSACATTKQDPLTSEENKVLVKYENQLIKENETVFATLTNRPLKVGNLTGLDVNPFVLHSIDGKELENLPLFSTSGFGDYTQTILKVRIPSGKHKVIIRGGGFRSFKLTDMGEIDFEAEKNYVTSIIPHEKDLLVSIYEYEEDRRFSLLDPDRYVLGKRIANIIRHGNLK